MPEEPGRQRQAGRHAAGRRDDADRRRGARRSGRRQHLRVHRRGPQGVDRHHPGAGGSAQGRRPPGRHRMHGRAVRRRAGRGAARGRPGRRLRCADQPRPQAAVRSATPDPDARPAEPAAAEVVEPMGVHQDRRGLRPQLRVLRDPVVPWSAAQPRRRRRSSTRSSSSRRRRSCSSPRTWPATARTGPTSWVPARSCRWSRRSVRWRRGPACCTSIPAI